MSVVLKGKKTPSLRVPNEKIACSRRSKKLVDSNVLEVVEVEEDQFDGADSDGSSELKHEITNMPNNSPADESESEAEEQPAPKPKTVRKPRVARVAAIKKQPAKPKARPKKIEVLDEQSAEEDDQPKEPAIPRGRPAKVKKPRAKSLWMTVLQENGFLVKGSSSKMPTKDSEDYKKVRALYDARKAALSASSTEA